MPQFSTASAARLATCDQRLQDLFNRVVQFRDCTIIEGFRDEAAQEAAFEQGRSKKHWPDGNHNHSPSLAVDVMAFPLDWGNRERNYLFVGFVLGVASQLGIPIRTGADWDGDGNPRNQTFNDLAHFELRSP